MSNPSYGELARYYAVVTGQSAENFLGRIIGAVKIGEEPGADDQMTNGLTTLYRACWELTELFRMVVANETTAGATKLKMVILGLLFEVRNKLDPWVAAPVRSFYELQGLEPGNVLARGRQVRKLFEDHLWGLKLVRDRALHAQLWHIDNAVQLVAEAMYRRRIPGTLHKALVDYGIQTVEHLCQDGFWVAGIGCFGVICIDGQKVPNATYANLGHELWPDSTP